MGDLMPTEFESLHHQLQFFDDQSKVLESWQSAHTEAMYCRYIEDQISLGLSIFANISRHQQRWSEEVQRQAEIFSWEIAEEYASCYRWWKKKSEELLKAIVDGENRGFQVGGAQEFREKLREVSLMSLDIQRIKQSMESLEAGHGVAFDQAMYALRHPVS
jgi:hypothetical protein